jgi:hypothetical protein
VSGDLISKKTRLEFREFLVAFTLREIQMEFDSAGVSCDLDYQPPVSGQRRSLVEQYYHTVNWSDWRDVRKVLQAYGYILNKALQVAENMTRGEEWAKRQRIRVDVLIRLLRSDGFQWLDGKLISGAGMPSLDDIKETAVEFDAKHLAEQIKRMEQSIEADPALAIGTAKELIETCCRTILTERGKPVTGAPDIPTLTKETLRELKLLPEGVPEEAKGREVIKRLLSNLATIGQGLAELRGLYGTGHGKDGKTQSIRSRHAKLAVGAAATLATFLFETHKETKT